MKKILAIVIVASVFAACKKSAPGGGGGNADVRSLHERLPGRWDIVSIVYDGTAANPANPGTILTFTGVGVEPTGYYHFDTVPDPNNMDFLMNFKAPLNFDGGGSITLPINEEGYATYNVEPDEGQITGVSYVIQPSGDTTVVPSAWDVLKNEEDEQIWASEKTFYWDNDPVANPDPIYVNMVTTLKRQ